jgi:membrane fusion protein
VTARLAAIPIDLQAAGAEARAADAGLDQQRTQTEAQSTYVVTATVAGRIVALPVQRGQTVAPGASLAVVTPQGSTLEAELYAPSRAAGFVREGQEVRLLYQAFPHQKFGTGQGVVTSVSRTVLAPAEIAIPGLQVQEPVFRVRVKLARDSVAAYGETVPLQPGMLLSADVVIDRRSLLEWLLDPLYAAGRR